MTTNNFQLSAFLREQRQFPNEDIVELSAQCDHSYIDIAQKVNLRTIGVYPTGFPILNGENWYTTGQPTKRDGYRRVYPFTAAGTIAHGINPSSIFLFANSFGSYTDGTNYYGAIFASNVAIAGQITFYVTPTNIVILAGAGAPAITSGLITLQWISAL